jgi:hypothetical protein
MGVVADIMVGTNVVTNIVLTVTNWYQIGRCTIDGVEVPNVLGQNGTYSLSIGPMTNVVNGNSVEIRIDAEPDDVLASDWNLTSSNSYSSAVLDWLLNEYPGYGPDDLSLARYHDLSGTMDIPLTLTEMYWLNIPPVHAQPHYGGSNIWFVAGMGSLVSGGDPVVEPQVMVEDDGTIFSNILMTVTMMITNTSPQATRKAWPPDRLNGPVYDGDGSSAWNGKGQPAWTGAVFSIVGALQKDDVKNAYYPLQQYTFKSDSFGAADDPQHAFQTRVKVMDPYSPGSMGYSYDWCRYRNVYDIWYRWVIKPRPDDQRVSTVPLEPNWTPPTTVTDP